MRVHALSCRLPSRRLSGRSGPVAGAQDYTTPRPPVVGEPRGRSPPAGPLPVFQPQESEEAEKNLKDTRGSSRRMAVPTRPTIRQRRSGSSRRTGWSDGGAPRACWRPCRMNGGGTYATTGAEFSACSDKPETRALRASAARDGPVGVVRQGRLPYQVGLPIVDGIADRRVRNHRPRRPRTRESCWSDPVDVTRDLTRTGSFFNDKQSITADSVSRRRAWVRDLDPGRPAGE
jgi:hypothetical protein